VSSSGEFYRSLGTHHRVEFCTSRGGPTCESATITRLRQQLATLQASHDSLVALTAEERAVVEAAVAAYHAERECVRSEADQYRRKRRDAVRALLASRAKGAPEPQPPQEGR
jgi:hypothetical protein